jgi:uncharacterized protein (DUF58 family)
MWWRKQRTHAAQPMSSSTPQRETPPHLLRRLQWTVLRPLAMYLGGDERSLLRGSGMELTEMREYQPGDDVRHIDWNVTARTEQPFVRESYVERALDVWMVLDVSASIDWGTAACLKRDRALEFAAVAGNIFAYRGNRIAAISFADRPLALFPPRSGRSHLLQMLALMRDLPRQARSGPTDLATALVYAQKAIQRRSLVLVVSDFLVPDGWQPILGRLAQRHDVVAVHLCDPREVELPDVGIITLEDPETGSQLIVDTNNKKLRERFREAAHIQTEQLRSAIRRSGADQLALSTSDALLPPLLRFLRARRIRSRLPERSTHTPQARPTR